MRQLRQALRPFAAAGWVVLIDTPAALWSSEAMTLAAAADATLLVTRVRTSRWSAMEQVAEAMRRDGVHALGVVLVGTGSHRLSPVTVGAYDHSTRRTDRRRADAHTDARRSLQGRSARSRGAIGNGEGTDPIGNGHWPEPRGGSHDRPSSPTDEPAPYTTPPSPSTSRRRSDI